MINKDQLETMRLRYEGMTYAQIAIKLGIIKETIEGWFRTGGVLEEEYSSFIKEQNKKTINLALEVFKQSAREALAVMQKVLKRAISRAEELDKIYKNTIATDGSKNAIEEAEKKLRSAEYRVVELAEKVLDRSGMPVVYKSEIKTESQKEVSDDELYERLTRDGIDPSSIKYIPVGPTPKIKAVQA